MAYVIRYFEGKQIRNRGHLRIHPAPWGMMSIVILLLISLVIPQSREVWLQLVYPLGDPETLEALEQFTQRVLSGTPIYDSVAVFCHQILSHADSLS